MQAKIQFAFVSAAAHCWIMVSSLLSVRPHRSLLPQLFPSHTDGNPHWLPTLPVYPGLSLRWLSLSDMLSSPGCWLWFWQVRILPPRITECVRLEGITARNQPSLPDQAGCMLLNTLSRCFFNISKEEDYITPLENQFKGSATCTVNLFFIFRWLSFCLLPLICWSAPPGRQRLRVEITIYWKQTTAE